MAIDLANLVRVEGCAATLRPSPQLSALYDALDVVIREAMRLEAEGDDKSAAYLALVEAIRVLQTQYNVQHAIEVGAWERFAPQYSYVFAH